MSIKFNLILLVLSINCHLFSQINETIVEDQIKLKDRRKTNYFKEKINDQQLSENNVLYNIPGLSITDSGGPLGSSSITYRGLSPVRLRIDLEGLSLNNPSTGLVDVGSLFLFAAQHLNANGSRISIGLPTFQEAKAKALLGLGLNKALKIGLIAGTPLKGSSDISIGAQMAQTDGDFTFYSPDVDIKGQKKGGFVRKNNDQRRIQVLARYNKSSPDLKAHGLIAFSLHEGGIPGFAFTPTHNLRSKSIIWGFSLGAAKNIKKTEFSLNFSNSFFNNHTTDDLKDNNLSRSSSHEITYGLKMLDSPDWIDIDLAQKLIIEKDWLNKKTRLSFGLVINREMRLKGPLHPTMFGSVSMLGVAEHGIISETDIGISIDPSTFTSLFLRFARSTRLPTFIELYAKNQFFVGNTDLKKEGIWDIELSSIFKINDVAELNVTGFLGYLTDTILYVPYHASMLRPINSEQAKRLGMDFSFSFTPNKFLKFDAKTSLMSTKLEKTKAPLPQTPFFSGLAKMRVGTEDFINLTLLSRFRSPTTADIYGSLWTKGYMVFDLTAAWQINPLIGISLALNNLLNQKDLRDSYQMPLPGFSAFAQVEVGGL